MKVKDHYDKHLANFYSWMTGNFGDRQLEQENFFSENGIRTSNHAIAIDLGAGHGLQSVSLAKLGFIVTAVDFNAHLLDELVANKKSYNIDIVNDDILSFLEKQTEQVALIVCMGDTITHLENREQLEQVICNGANLLVTAGKFIISFRDLTEELMGEQRFIPVKSDSNRILTCFIEYVGDHAIIHDMFYEKKDNSWIQTVSSYPKLRFTAKDVEEIFVKNSLMLIRTQIINRMIYMIAEKC